MAATATELSYPEIESLCQRYYTEDSAHERKFHVVDYSVQGSTDAPAGFLGQHQFLSVRIQVQDDAGKQWTETLRFFTKSAPVHVASRMEYMEEYGVFKKEICVYRDVLPTLQRILPDVAPRCYYATNSLLVFEDLSQQEYRMAAGQDGLLDYPHLKCALKTLAALHVSSIVYELRCGRKIPELHDKAVVENAYPLGIDEKHVRWQNFHNGISVMRAFIKEMPKYADHLDRIEKELLRHMQKIFEYSQTSSKYQNVFLHGDLWANNCMFRYSKLGGIPIQCRLVDFQLARYAPPALDVVTLLTIPTSRDSRAKHWDDLISDYFRFVTEFLKHEKLDIADYLPWSQFLESVKEFRICGLIESFLFSHLTVLPSGATQKLCGSEDGFSDFFNRKRVEICLDAFHTDRVYRERLTDMIEDLLDNFVLSE